MPSATSSMEATTTPTMETTTTSSKASSTSETSTTVEATAARAALKASSKTPISVVAAPYGKRSIVWARTPRVKVKIKVTIVVSAVKASEASVIIKRRFSY